MRSVRLLCFALSAFGFAAACSDPNDPPPVSILSGLSEGQSNDTTTGTPPTQPSPGSIKGYVIGPGTGSDTIGTAPRLAGVAVTVYPHMGWNGQEPVVGTAAATLTTDVNGFFQSPTLEGGDYLVTFVPAAGSEYRGVYVPTTIHAGSATGTWWVILARK